MQVLGISCFYHDAAACLVDDGEIVAAAQEERFTRIKHDQNFPENAVRYCLAEGGVSGTVDAVAFYDKPILKFHRILETYLSIAPGGFKPFAQAVPKWLQE
jgi:carbamoyltransferase